MAASTTAPLDGRSVPRASGFRRNNVGDAGMKWVLQRSRILRDDGLISSKQV